MVFLFRTHDKAGHCKRAAGAASVGDHGSSGPPGVPDDADAPRNLGGPEVGSWPTAREMEIGLMDLVGILD